MKKGAYIFVGLVFIITYSAFLFALFSPSAKANDCVNIATVKELKSIDDEGFKYAAEVAQIAAVMQIADKASYAYIANQSRLEVLNRKIEALTLRRSIVVRELGL